MRNVIRRHLQEYLRSDRNHEENPHHQSLMSKGFKYHATSFKGNEKIHFYVHDDGKTARVNVATNNLQVD